MRTAALSLLGLILLAACDGTDTEGGGAAAPVVRGVAYVGVSVGDLDAAARFYSRAADLEEVARGELKGSTALDGLAGRPGVVARTRMLASSNAQLRFMQFASRPETASAPMVPVNGPGIAHVCYQVAQETRTYERFLDNGARHVGARDMVQLNPRNPVLYAYARDPDGIMFEVEHVDVAALNLETPPQFAYRLRHVALATPDIGRLVDFYSALLDQPDPRRLGRFWGLSGDKLDQVSGLEDTRISMAFFQIGNLELEIAEYLSHPTELPAAPRALDAYGYNMIVLDVTSLEAARQKVIAAGGTIVSEPEAMDRGQILFARDPDGNLLGLLTADPASIISPARFQDRGL